MPVASLAQAVPTADGGFPPFEWNQSVLVIGAAAIGAYAWAFRARRATGADLGMTRLRWTALVGAIATYAVASLYPIHTLGETRLFSVHMMQHSIYTLVLAPLVLIGTPAWFARAFLRRSGLFRAVRFLARFFPATIVFNVVLVVTHVPGYVNTVVGSELLHFLTHALIVASALVVWMPLLSPLPEIPRLDGPLGMLYLFLQSIIPTVPASFLTFGARPLYRYYEDLPRLWGVSPLDDMQMAGLIMKILNGLFTWVVIAIVFFRWNDAEDGGRRPGTRHYDQLDRELHAELTRTPSDLGLADS